MLREFKDFALKGNVLDMAVGIIIGAAFTAIVASMVDDVIMPPIGGIDFSDKYIQLTMRDQAYPSLAAARDAGAAVLAYGSFINAVIKFVIVAFALFILIKQFNNLKRMLEREQAARAAAPAEPPADVRLLTEIRDRLAKKG